MGLFNNYTNGKNRYYLALFTTVMYCSSAIVIDGAFGLGAMMSIFKFASVTA